VSTQDQADSGAGLAAQEAAIRAECEQKGWMLVRIATDVGSGKSMKGRPELAGALADLDAGHADVLLAAKLDRVSRSAADFAHLMERASKKGWKIVVLDVAVDTTTPSGELLVGVMVHFAQFERRIIGQRTKDALAQKRAQGVRLGRPRQPITAIDQRIAAERAAGRSLGAIARDLTAEGVPTAMGGAWTSTTVKRIAERVAERQLVSV
jgi:DNA invertase Pin-like site-specific DNA recombinase